MGATTATRTRSGTSVIITPSVLPRVGSGRQPTDRNQTELRSQWLLMTTRHLCPTAVATLEDGRLVPLQDHYDFFISSPLCFFPYLLFSVYPFLSLTIIISSFRSHTQELRTTLVCQFHSFCSRTENVFFFAV